MLHAIEKATRQKIDLMELPSNDLINERRISRFKERITHTLENEDLNLFVKLVEDYQEEQEVDSTRVAAALAQLLQGSAPFLLQKKSARQQQRELDGKQHRKGPNRKDESARKDPSAKKERPAQKSRHEKGGPGKTQDGRREEGMERYRIEVGSDHDVAPSNIVGAIANESGIDSQYIGKIDIFNDYSLIDLPEGMPKAILKLLKKVWVSGQKLNITRVAGTAGEPRKQHGKRDNAGSRRPTPGKPRSASKSDSGASHGSHRSGPGPGPAKRTKTKQGNSASQGKRKPGKK
jgi:ATP-dependent RNA helicase DeaD